MIFPVEVSKNGGSSVDVRLRTNHELDYDRSDLINEPDPEITLDSNNEDNE